jgi:hypothetical protein
MWMKVATAGSVGAIIVGAGAAALAFSGSSGPPPSGTAPDTALNAASDTTSGQAADALLAAAGPDAAQGLRPRDRIKLHRFEHGEWVTRKDSTDVTHDAIKGTVSSVGATSIAVKAADGFSLTFAVDSNTKVVLREHGKGSAKKGTIADVKTGDTVLVAGIKTGAALDAKHVIDAGMK